MNCKTCGYALWNLRTRQCPECGEEFAPSQFELTPNAVAFCCPHCDQAYYGTDATGHLVPREFTCVTCSRPVTMDEMVVRPAQGVHERDTSAARVPWIVSEDGWWTRFIKTVGQALIAPHRLGVGLPVDSPALHAWLFAGIVAAVTITVLVLPLTLFVFALGPAGLFMPIFTAGLVLVLWVAALIFWGVGAHLLLKMTGTTRKSMAGTYECICYSSGANVTSAVPCFGMNFGWIWWMVSATLMLKEAQRVSGPRAALAGILPPVVFVALLVGGWITLMAFATAGVGAAMGGMTVPTPLLTRSVSAPAAAQHMTNALRTHARNADGGYAPHAAQLIVDGHVTPVMFLVSTSDTQLGDVPVGGAGGSNLRDFETLDVAEQREVAKLAAEQLPENVIAHRLGDFVFTYHGFDDPAPDWRLWLFIVSPDPDRNTVESFDGQFMVGVSFAPNVGTAQPIPATDFERELRAQNRVRAGLGLAPLPHPREVTHTRPAVAPDDAVNDGE